MRGFGDLEAVMLHRVGGPESEALRAVVHRLTERRPA